MYPKQKELLEKLDNAFIRQLMKTANRETYDKGAFVFHQNKPARHLYILIKGCVSLKVGEIGHTVYVANHPGEIFGWSSILDRDTYSASAECLEPTVLRRIDRDSLAALLVKDKANGLVFYKKLAEMLGNRLLHSYSLSSQHRFPVSEGSGQLQELVETD